MKGCVIRRKSDGKLWNYLAKGFTTMPEFCTAEYLSDLDMTQEWLRADLEGADGCNLSEVEIVEFELIERRVISPQQEH